MGKKLMFPYFVAPDKTPESLKYFKSVSEVDHL